MIVLLMVILFLLLGSWAMLVPSVISAAAFAGMALCVVLVAWLPYRAKWRLELTWYMLSWGYLSWYHPMVAFVETGDWHWLSYLQRGYSPHEAIKMEFGEEGW